MYDFRQTVLCFSVIFIIHAAAENAGDDLDLSRVFRTPKDKDFSRVDFDHFEILERNNFDPVPETQQQEAEAPIDDVLAAAPAVVQEQPKSVANAQVMLRFGGDDIRGKNCIETPNKGGHYPPSQSPNNNHQHGSDIRYPSPYPAYCHPSHQTSPYSHSPYGYPYPPYAFPGPYYPSPEYNRGPYGMYHGQRIPYDDSYPCSHERRNFLEKDHDVGNTSVNHPKIILTTDLTDDVIPECQKCTEKPVKPPTEKNLHHHHPQNHPSDDCDPNETGPIKLPHFFEKKDLENKDVVVEIPLQYHHHNQPSEDCNPNENSPNKFPYLVKEDHVIEKSPNHYHHHQQNPSETVPDKSPHYGKKDHVIEKSTQHYHDHQKQPSEECDSKETGPVKSPHHAKKNHIIEKTLQHHHYQKQPIKESDSEGTGSVKFTHYVKQDKVEEKSLHHQHHYNKPSSENNDSNKTVHVQFLHFAKKDNVDKNLQHHHPHHQQQPSGTDPIKSPHYTKKYHVIEESPHHHYQKQPSDNYDPEETGPIKLPHYVKKDHIEDKSPHHQHHYHKPGKDSDPIKTGPVQFPHQAKKDQVGDNISHHHYHSHNHPSKTGPVKSPHFITNEDVTEPEVIFEIPKYNGNHHRHHMSPPVGRKYPNHPPHLEEKKTIKSVAELECTTPRKEESPICEDETTIAPVDCTTEIPSTTVCKDAPITVTECEIPTTLPPDCETTTVCEEPVVRPIKKPGHKSPSRRKHSRRPVVIIKPLSTSPDIKYTDVLLGEAKPETGFVELEGWLNKSLIPYECQVCGHKPKLLVSYPLTHDRDSDQLNEDIRISGCQCCHNQGFCDCCNHERDPSIPFGKRFPSDMDSLQQVTKPGPVIYDERRPADYSTGYTSSSGSSLSKSVSQLDNQRPIVCINGYQSSDGSRYYSDPSRDVYYHEPKTVDVIRTPYPHLPVIEHTRVEQPEWYSVAPKQHLLPVKYCPPANPDLLPTDVFVCKECNTPHQRKLVCHRQYVPRDVIEPCSRDRVPARAENLREVIEGEPIVRYDNFLGNSNGQREPRQDAYVIREDVREVPVVPARNVDAVPPQGYYSVCRRVPRKADHKEITSDK